MRVFKYIKKYWLWAILAPITMIGEVLMDLYQPKLMSVIVDNGINGKAFKDGTNQLFVNFITSNKLWGSAMDPKLTIILNAGLLMIVLVLFGGLCGVLSGVFTNKASFNFSNDLRKDAYRHIMALSFEQTDSFTTGSLVTRMTNDVTQVQNMASMFMRMMVRTLMQFVMGTIFLLSIKKEFSYVLMVAIPLEIVFVIIFITMVSPHFNTVQKAVDDVNSVVQENVTGARVVKAYVKEEYEKDRFGQANQRLYDINWKVFKMMAYVVPVMTITLSLCIVAIYYIGGVQIYANFKSGLLENLSIGEVMAAVNYTTIVLMGFMMLAIMFQAIVRGLASVRRLNEILKSEPVIYGNNDAVEVEPLGTVEFKNVSFTYPNTAESILSNISFKVNKGEKIGILGATGSGKTTLVNLIPRFYDCTEGEILVDGINVKKYKLDSLRDRIGIALQKSELYTGTIKDNIVFGKENVNDEDIIKASKIAQADTFINSFNDKYDTLVTEKGSSLSGGQKQRIAIARAILKKPEILIFDDSTSALDLSTEKNLYDALNNEMKDTTLIIIAQRVASVKNADRIMVINEGTIEAFGTHDELIKNSLIYQDIYNSQLKKDGDSDGRK